MTVELLLLLILLVLVVAMLPKLVGFVLKALVMLCVLVGAFVVLVALLA